MGQKGLETIAYKTRGAGRRALLCVLLGAAILAASLAVRSRLGLPPAFSLQPRATAAPKQDAVRAERELTLSAQSLYALQLGAFTQESAARQLAQEYAARGAAGYIRAEDGAWRVLAAAYPTRAEAQAVQTRLSAQGISAYIHPCARQAVTLRAGGTGSQIAALAEAVGYLDGLGDKLFALSAALDARETPAEQALTALDSEGVTSAALEGALLSAFPEGLPGSLLPLGDALRAVADAAREARDANSAARTGAALKRCQLSVFFCLQSFTDDLL